MTESFPLLTSQVATARLADEDFAKLTDYFYARTGISFRPNKRYFVDKRVLACMREFGTDDFSSYFAALRLGVEPGLFQRLVNALTINETYFMREDYQFDALLQYVLPALQARRGARGNPVRILSMGCSTGDEAYSIAIEMLERWEDIETTDVQIVGADIDTQALDIARLGVYRWRALQRLPRSVLHRFFSRLPDGCYRLDPAISDAIPFVQANLADDASMTRFSDFDVVFCRNLLIYFDELSTRLAVRNLYEAMSPGGFCFLGHSESMSRFSSLFVPRRFQNKILYEKPGGL